MSHIETDHHPDHSVEAVKSLNAAFITAICLNAGYVVIEAVFGFIYDSMGLLSDAGHNLSDVASLLIAMVAFRLAARKPDSEYTFGYKKFTVQASFINALLLSAATGAILVESVGKLFHPARVDGDAIAWVAAAGVIVNGVTAWIFVKDKNRDMNIKAAFLHMAADTLVSVGVVVSGFVIHFTGWYILDPLVGIAIALVIAWTTRGLLVESTRLSIDAVPESVDMTGLEKALASVKGVRSLHHLHVWALSTTETALTVHVVLADVTHLNETIAAVKERARRFGIAHSTIEAETESSPCNDHLLFTPD